MDYINSVREKVYAPLNELIKKLKTDSKVSDMCAFLFDFLDSTGLE